MSQAMFAVGTLPVWDHPIRLRRRKMEVDQLSGTYRVPMGTTLAAGDAVPGYPGMIIFDLDETTTGQSRKYQIEAQGSLDQSNPTKTLSRGTRRTLDEGWDERTVRYISWHVAAKSITGTASTDVIDCTAHGFSNGQKVILPEITGGTGLVANSITAFGTIYYIISAATNSFQLSLTAGGSAVNFTSNITAGKVLAAEFALGAAHPDHPYLFLFDLTTSDDNSDWITADATYRGLEGVKPYQRVINGNVVATNTRITGIVSLTDDIYQNYPPVDSTTNATLTGTDLDIEYDACSLTLTDTYITSTEPPTDHIGRFWTPPDPPDVTVFSIASFDAAKYFFPFGWKCISMPVRKIPGRDLWMVSPTFVYQVPSMPTTAA